MDQPPPSALDAAAQPLHTGLQDLSLYGDIDIKVTGYTLEKGSLKSYVKFHIQGQDAQGGFECCRRYKEFAKLRTYMRRKWLGLYIPLLPEKKATVRTKQGNTEPQFVETRRMMLEAFCQKVAEYPWLYGSEEFQMFLRSRGDFRTELQHASVPNLFSLRMVYSQAFPNRPDQDPGPVLASFSSLVASVLGLVKFVKTECRSVAAHATAMTRETARLAESLNSLEQNCLAVLSPGMKVGYFPNEVNMDSENPFLGLFYWLIKEENELQTMSECTESRFALLSALNDTRGKLEKAQRELAGLRAGDKLSLASILLFKSRAKRMMELDTKIRDFSGNLDHLSDLLVRVDGWLVQTEMPRFKAARVQAYISALRLFAAVLTKEYGALAGLYRAMAE